MKKIRNRKAATLTICYLSAAVLALGVLAGVNGERAKAYERYAEMNCQHAFGELVTAMSEMDTALQKSVYATSPAMIGAVCTELFGKAMTAQMSLGVLPFSSEELEKTSGFISRVGDYAFALSRNARGGAGYTAEELANLKALSETAEILADNMRALQTDLAEGIVTMDSLMQAPQTLEEEVPLPTVGGSMRLIEQEFPETPSLVYDGPFSEHLLRNIPIALEGTAQVNRDRAREIAAEFSGIGKSRMYLSCEREGQVPCFCFCADVNGGTVLVSVTKQGGKVLGMLSSRECAESELSMEDAGKIAKRFLEEHDYLNMRETYSVRQNNRITLNYAYTQDGVLCYSDLVKVTVACDTGSVCGFEAMGYLMSHCKRTLQAPAVSAVQAAERVPEGLQQISEQLTLVPSDGKYEKLCYEFKCRDEHDRQCLIYVNAETGEQEKILLLLEDETGTLTI